MGISERVDPWYLDRISARPYGGGRAGAVTGKRA